MVITVFCVLAATGLLLHAMQIAAVNERLNRPAPKGGYAPPVSVLKPLKGLDDGLFDNLESLCLQDYPEYEVIFALRDPNDAAIKVARMVKDKYPDRDISIVVERCEDGLNPKVNNLIPAYRRAKHGFVLISDSNVRVRPDYIRETAAHMADREVGLVSNIIRGVGARTLGALFENLHLNTFIVGGVSFMDVFLGMPCVVGKSMLMRKSHLDELGGLHAVKDFLAEDYLLGRMMHEAGHKVVLSNHVIDNVNEYWQVGQFMRRHARWGRLRWNIDRPAYVLELIFNPVVISLVPLFVVGPTRQTVLLPAFTWTLKAAGDWWMGRMTGTGMRPLSFVLSPVKDVLIAMVWFVPIFSNKVEWRGDRYIIAKDSALFQCPDDGKATLPAY